MTEMSSGISIQTMRRRSSRRVIFCCAIARTTPRPIATSNGRSSIASTGRWIISTSMARGNAQPALWLVDEDAGETKLSFAELSERSNRIANALRGLGVRRGDRILVMLGNVVPLWECMLAAMKLGAVIVPATTLLTRNDLADRFARGRVRHIVVSADAAAKFADLPGDYTRIVVGKEVPGWISYEKGYEASAAIHAGRRNPRRRSAAALFHLRHHGDAEARVAQPSKLSGRPSLDHVLARASARRRASEHFIAGLGQARLELFLFAVESRRRRSSSSISAASMRAVCSTPSCAAASPRFARRRRCGAC